MHLLQPSKGSRLDRLGSRLHGVEKGPHLRRIHDGAIEYVFQRRAMQHRGCKHIPARLGARQAGKLCHNVAHGPQAACRAMGHQIRCEEVLEALNAIPVW